MHTSGLAVATHSILANYGGDANNTASASAMLSQVVNKAASTTTLTSSVNPSTVGSSVTFTATVAGSSPTGSVNFTDGGSSIAGCAAVALSSGNARRAAPAGLAAATHSIVANYGGDANNTASASATLSQVVNGGGGGGSSIDVALAANGGMASASSTYVATGYSFPVSAVIDGDRAGLNWGQGGGWNDAHPNVWPDWVQINFSGQKTINQVDRLHAAGQLHQPGRSAGQPHLHALRRHRLPGPGLERIGVGEPRCRGIRQQPGQAPG